MEEHSKCSLMGAMAEIIKTRAAINHNDIDSVSRIKIRIRKITTQNLFSSTLLVPEKENQS